MDELIDFVLAEIALCGTQGTYITRLGPQFESSIIRTLSTFPCVYAHYLLYLAFDYAGSVCLTSSIYFL
jgi:hypothetical protein